mgnify:CR=1 FL=1
MNEYRGLVDVIIPVYNGEKTVARALQSVVDQDFGLVRKIIVIDDGSKDASVSAVFALGLENIELVKTENRGVAAARNLGIELACAEWVAFLDADDTWEPGKLAAHFSIPNEFDVGFIFSATNLSTNRRSSYITVQMLSHSNFVATSSVLVKREVLEHAKPIFALGMAFAEDYLAWLKCLSITSGYFFSEVFVNYHVSERPRYRWVLILRSLWRVNTLYADFLRFEGVTLKERLSIQCLLLIGSFRSILSIANRFLKSGRKGKNHE